MAADTLPATRATTAAREANSIRLPHSRAITDHQAAAMAAKAARRPQDGIEAELACRLVTCLT
jgi:hypothetical protein